MYNGHCVSVPRLDDRTASAAPTCKGEPFPSACFPPAGWSIPGHGICRGTEIDFYDNSLLGFRVGSCNAQVCDTLLALGMQAKKSWGRDSMEEEELGIWALACELEDQKNLLLQLWCPRSRWCRRPPCCLWKTSNTCTMVRLSMVGHLWTTCPAWNGHSALDIKDMLGFFKLLCESLYGVLSIEERIILVIKMLALMLRGKVIKKTISQHCNWWFDGNSQQHSTMNINFIQKNR